MSNDLLLAPCPSEDRLRQLLSDQLEGPDYAAIETHLETCTVCQAIIARLSDGGMTADWQRVVDGENTADGITQDFLERAKHVPGPAADVLFPPGHRLGPYQIDKVLGQ